MSGVLQALLAGFGGAATDEYFEYVTMLLPGNGTNGAQNNTFLDSSTNNFTITRNGNTTQGTFTPYGSNWSNYFDGTGDYLSVADNSAFDLGSGDFTLEAWINMADVTPSKAEWVICQWQSDSQNSWGFRFETDGTLNFYYSTNGNNATVIGTATPGVSANTWAHIAVVRNGTTLTIYVDGVSKASGSLSGVTLFNSSASVMVGNQAATGFGQTFTGYISNARVVKGTAVYTSAFTPSTSPLTAITNTSLLTCQSNRFIDNSSNNFTITRNGDVSVQRFSPFAPTSPYSTSVIGGSGYFDGSGDYLNGPTTGQFAPTGDFTISMWFYPTSFAASYYVLAGSWNAGASDEWLIQYDNTGAIRFLTTTDSTFSAAGVVKLNQWQFLSVSRSGSTVTGYINGTSFRSYTLTGTVGSATKTVYVGIQSGTTWPYVGYISDYRLVAGSAQSATPPTSPATAISGTNTLLNFTNGGIIDNAMMNDLETVGNAQISTSVSKFGGGSMAFDGNGDYLKIAASPNLVFGTGDFTIECWIYVASNPAQYTNIISNWTGSDPAWLLDFSNSSGNIRFNDNSVVYLTSSSALTTGQWNHVAVSRSGTSLKMFFNGTQVASATNSTSFGSASSGVFVGAYYDNTYPLNGYIDDLRITKGIARYTANFTPPTAPFPLS